MASMAWYMRQIYYQTLYEIIGFTNISLSVFVSLNKYEDYMQQMETSVLVTGANRNSANMKVFRMCGIKYRFSYIGQRDTECQKFMFCSETLPMKCVFLASMKIMRVSESVRVIIWEIWWMDSLRILIGIKLTNVAFESKRNWLSMIVMTFVFGLLPFVNKFFASLKQ